MGQHDTVQNRQPFSQPSPGAILKQQARDTAIGVKGPQRRSGDATETDSYITGDPFAQSFFADALLERGVMLAPLIVQWEYRVPAAKPFAKWIRTKDILLSQARLDLNENTVGVRYFGTYISQTNTPADGAASADNTPDKETGRGQVGLSGEVGSGEIGVICKTLWGFANEASMNHMFDLCRGQIKRVSIVETDLKDFVHGLKGHIRQVGAEHFKQSAFVSSAVV